MKIVIYYLCLISFLTFLFYGWDKRQAVKSRKRISERIFHLLVFLGGSIGAFAGQRFFRHKTVKKSFLRVFWVIVIMQISAIIFLINEFK